MPRRLNRQQQKQRTRERLLRSAAKIFAKHGIHAASVEEVADDAGFTKGAVYANFANKDDLLLTLLEEHYDQWLVQLRSVEGSSPSIQEGALRAGSDYMTYLSQDPAWPKLFLELWLHALRRTDVRRALISRNDQMRDAITEIYRQRLQADGLSLAYSFEELSRMSYAMGNGVAMDMALEPSSVPPDLFAKMLNIFVAGVLATSAEHASAHKP